PARARQRSAAHDPRGISRAHRRRHRQVDGGRGRQQFRAHLRGRESYTECRFGIRSLLSSPRKRGSILQSRRLWVPAFATELWVYPSSATHMLAEVGYIGQYAISSILSTRWFYSFSAFYNFGSYGVPEAFFLACARSSRITSAALPLSRLFSNRV